jgi:hypothetical protein
MPFSDAPVAYLADFGRPVVAGATEGLGILDMPGEYILDQRVITDRYSLTVESSKFSGLDYGDTLTHGGQSYQVKEGPLVVGDGVFCVFLLQKL